jgi:copper chaperone CopZ
MKTEKILIENLKCKGCANTIKSEISKLDSVKNVVINHENSSVTIDYEKEENLREIFTAKLKSLGYPENGKGNMFVAAKSYVSCAIGRMSS